MVPGIKDILMILPEIVVAVAACVLLMVEFLCRKNDRAIIGVFALLTAATAACISIYLMTTDYMGGVAFAGMFILDGYSTMFKLIFYLATILSIVLSFYYTREEGIRGGEYYTLMLFSLCGMMVMASGRDLLTIYIGLELMSLPVYVLTGFLEKDKRSVEGAMKYVILGGFSSGILLYGISIVYGITGSTELTAIAKAFGEADGLTPVLGLAIVGLICGFGFKVAAVPFHAWTPDVYEGAPTPVTAFMSVGPKAAAFAVFLRVFTEGLVPVYEHWQFVVAVVAVATMFYGNIVAIVQTNIKRMLAYSSIGHAGYALLGLLPA
ncbi:MAG TPA: NADH-quinone oxidoreductase subunit N, partial [Deltaproteobacteria bacterium]|nr:NADH-quinone oxidoreductase subunit N [Deltaproteobacteria bacterium]